MDELIRQFAERVPALGVLAFIVVTFLKHLRLRDRDYLAAIKDFHTENVQARARDQVVIERNTAVLAENTRACDAQRETLCELTDVLRRGK